MTLICTFLRIVWGGGQWGWVFVVGTRYVSNLTRLSVRYDSVLSTLSISLALICSCVLSSNKGALLWVGDIRDLTTVWSVKLALKLSTFDCFLLLELFVSVISTFLCQALSLLKTE